MTLGDGFRWYGCSVEVVRMESGYGRGGVYMVGKVVSRVSAWKECFSRG